MSDTKPSASDWIGGGALGLMLVMATEELSNGVFGLGWAPATWYFVVAVVALFAGLLCRQHRIPASCGYVVGAMVTLFVCLWLLSLGPVGFRTQKFYFVLAVTAGAVPGFIVYFLVLAWLSPEALRDEEEESTTQPQRPGGKDFSFLDQAAAGPPPGAHLGHPGVPPVALGLAPPMPGPPGHPTSQAPTWPTPQLVACPHCRGHVATDPRYRGQAIACPHCSQAFVAP